MKKSMKPQPEVEKVRPQPSQNGKIEFACSLLTTIGKSLILTGAVLYYLFNNNKSEEKKKPEPIPAVKKLDKQ